jgi:hypothetical protein
MKFIKLHTPFLKKAFHNEIPIIKQKPRTWWLHCRILPTLIINKCQSFVYSFIRMKRIEHFQTHISKPNCPDTKSYKNTAKPGKLHANFHDHRCKNPQQNTSQSNSTSFKKNNSLWSISGIEELLNICK